MSTSVKFCFRDEIRRVACPKKYQAVEALVRNLFPDLGPSTPISLTWKDEDGDDITVSSDLELKEALTSVKVVKFHVHSKATAGSSSISVGIPITAFASTPTTNNITEKKEAPPAPASPPKGVSWVVNPGSAKPGPESWTPFHRTSSRAPQTKPITLRKLCTKVVGLAHEASARAMAKKYGGLDIMRVAWEDTARNKNSSAGPNITDMTLNVAGLNMPLVRTPNYRDVSWDVPMSKVNCIVGNHRVGEQVRACSLDKILQQFWEVSDADYGTSLYAPNRDSHVLVQSQACFLPIAQGGDAKFNVAVRNYQSKHNNSACLVLTVTSKGTSAQLCKGGVTTLYFNDQGEKRSFLGQRLTDDRKERGVALEGEMTQQEKQDNVIVVIQIPLKKKNKAGWGSNNSSWGGGFGFITDDLCDGFGADVFTSAVFTSAAVAVNSSASSSKIEKKKCRSAEPPKMEADVENVIVKLGEKEGAFESLRGKNLVRDDRFPVRVTLQYYKGTSNAECTPEVIQEIAGQFAQAQKNADSWGSLVVEPSAHRPTAPKPTVVPAPKQMWSQAKQQCPSAHPLNLFSTPNHTFACDVCNSGHFPTSTTMFGCRVCNWDVCLSCMYKAKASDNKAAPQSFDGDWSSGFF